MAVEDHPSPRKRADELPDVHGHDRVGAGVVHGPGGALTTGGEGGVEPQSDEAWVDANDHGAQSSRFSRSGETQFTPLDAVSGTPPGDGIGDRVMRATPAIRCDIGTPPFTPGLARPHRER